MIMLFLMSSIEKWRGYISYEKALKKYNVMEIKIQKPEKTKRLFKRK